MITDLRVGDYIEKSELDTEQKYNDVVTVFKQWGFNWGSKNVGGFSNFKVNAVKYIRIGCDGFYLSTKGASPLKRKLTYNEIMSLKKVDVDNCNIEGNKYHREIIGFCGTKVEVDVYRVLDAFKTGSAALDHAAKKILCTGIRGHKDYVTDIDNAIESLQEARALHLQKVEIDNQ